MSGPPPYIRAVALGVLRRGDEVLVFRGYDAVKDQAFYRPLGGGIEFGETAEEAIIREMREEIGAQTKVLRHLMTVENLFTYEGQPGHEIVFVFDLACSDGRVYEQDALVGMDDAAEVEVGWVALRTFDAQAGPLYPHGLLELLVGSGE